MKICMVTRAYITNSSGGMEDYTAKLCESLSDLGHSVYIITSCHPDNIKKEIKNGIEIHYLENENPASYKGGFFRKSYQKFKELNKQLNFDLLHFQSSAGLGFLFKEVSIPIIITMHGSLETETRLSSHYRKDGFVILFKNYLKLYKRVLIHHLTISLMNKSNIIIVPSTFSKKIFSKYVKNSGKLKVVYHGLDNDEFKKINKVEAKEILGFEDKKIILCFSRLVQEKGVQTVIQAFKDLQRNNYQLVICGDGSYRNQLVNLVESQKIKNVIFTGLVPEDLKSTYYSAADLFVNPELTKPAFGLVTIEAMACGTPVIATKHGATEEIIDNQDFLFTPGNSFELGEKLQLFFDKNKDELNILNNEVYKNQIKNYSLEKMICNTIDLYKEALGR
jgi:glycosyltransferase involved in cell wall biosynthesis